MEERKKYLVPRIKSENEVLWSERYITVPHFEEKSQNSNRRRGTGDKTNAPVPRLLKTKHLAF